MEQHRSAAPYDVGCSQRLVLSAELPAQVLQADVIRVMRHQIIGVLPGGLEFAAVTVHGGQGKQEVSVSGMPRSAAFQHRQRLGGIPGALQRQSIHVGVARVLRRHVSR